MNKFGQTIRTLRKSRQLTLRELAAFLNIDISILSKVERGQRSGSRTMAMQVAEYFELDSQSLLDELLSDQIANMIYEEENCTSILRLAEEKVNYLNKK